MQWTIRVSVPRRYENDLERFSLRPFTLRQESIYHSVRGQFKLNEPFAHYGFQTDGHIGWGVRNGSYFRGTVLQYLRAFGFDEGSLDNRLYILDPLNMFSYGWYIEEPTPRGQAGAHILHGALKSNSYMSNPYGRGVDTCFNHDRENEPTYFPSPSSAFFEDANSFIYTGNPNDPRITCPALIRSDWWERLRFYLRIFDTVYILKPTEYARRCYYRLIEDELPAKLTAIITRDFYPHDTLLEVARRSFGVEFPSKVKGYGFGVSARVGFAYIAPSFAQREPTDPFAPYPITGLLSPTPPFISEVPSLVNTAVGKDMSYSPYTPGPCMFSGPYYRGRFTAVDGWGVVPVITGMTEREFDEWRRSVREQGGGGITLFQIHPDGDAFYVRTGQPFLVWGGTSGDYILLEPFDTDAQMESTVKVKVLKEGWHTTSGGVRFYSIYFVQVSVILQTTTYYLDRVNAYEPPEPKKIEEIFFPYFTVERVHKLLETERRKLLLKPKSAFLRLSKVNFTDALNSMINPDAKEYVSISFGTAFPEMGQVWWQCSNVNVWHLGGAQLPVEWYSDKISAYAAQKDMSDPTANRRFFVNLMAPLMDEVARSFVAPRISGENKALEEIIAKHAPSKVALTGWKAFNVTHRSPRSIPWTMTSSGNIYTIEDKATTIGMFQIYSKIPFLPANNDGLNIAKRLLSQLPVFDQALALPDGYVMRPLPPPSVLGASEKAENGADEGLVVIIGLWSAGGWAALQPDRSKLRQQGFVINGLGAFVPVPSAMLYRDPSESKPDSEIYPNKLLFAGSCVEPPEIQVIPLWFIWAGGILLESRNSANPDEAVERLREKAKHVARKIQLVNAVKWRLLSFPDDWETFEKILPFLDFSHLPLVESGRSLVEWTVVNNEKRLRLATYYQPLIVADIKPTAPVETAGFEGATAVCAQASSVSVASAVQREHRPQPVQEGLPSESIIQAAQRAMEALAYQVANIGGYKLLPPHNIVAPFDAPFSVPTDAAPYFGQYNAAIPPFTYTEIEAPQLKEVDVDTEIFHPPYQVRFSVVPHPYHNEWIWDSQGFYSDLRKTLLEIASVVPVTLPSASTENISIPPKLNHDALLFYRRIGLDCLGRNIDFWEKCSLVAGNGRLTLFALLKERRPVFSGFMALGGFLRNIHRRDYLDIMFASPFIAPWSSQVVQNIANLAAGIEVFKEGDSLWRRYIVQMRPYDTWLGLELWSPPVIAFFGKSLSGHDIAAEFTADKGAEVSLAWGANEYPPIGDKGWRFVIGYRHNLALVAHLGIPPLPSFFLPAPEGAVRDYGSFWRQRFGKHRFPADLFTWVVPPLGWLGCVGVPGVSRLGLDPILPDERKRFEEGTVEYAYGNKERLRKYWDDEIRLEAEHAHKEYYLELPLEDELVIPEEERLYPDDKEVRERGEFEGRRLITLCKSSRWQRQRIFWSFRSYFEIRRTRVKQENALLAPEEVRLGEIITRDAVVHKWVAGRPRSYLLPLFPVQWWGAPIAFSWGNSFPFWRDIIPNEYGSVTFSLSIAYPFPFGRLKAKILEHLEEIGEKVPDKLKETLRRTLIAMGLLAPDQTMLIKDMVSLIPDSLLVGQPWYAPFAAYYITEQALLPHYLRRHGRLVYGFVEDFIRRWSERLLHVNLAPTVFPEWYASKRVVNALGRLNFNRLVDGAGRRYPICVVAQRSPFLSGGAVYSEEWDTLFYFSNLNIPDLFVAPALPEDIFASEYWLEVLLTPTAGKLPFYINNTAIREHVSRFMNMRVDFEYSGLFANNFVAPFALTPLQTYPFSIPPFRMENWGLLSVPHWEHDILDGASDGFICDAEDLIYCDLSREDFAVRTRLKDEEAALIALRDCAMPNQTIGMNTWGGYAYLHRIVLPPTPVIVHSSFNFGLKEKTKEKSFRLVEPRLAQVPLRHPSELFVRSYFYGMRLGAFSPADPPPLPDLLSSFMRKQGDLTQAFGIVLPVRFYFSHLRERLGAQNENLEGNVFAQEERGESPLAFYGRLLAGLPAFIFACSDWQIRHEIIDISFSERDEVFLILRGNELPRYLWVNLFNENMVGSKFSALAKVEYLLRLYFLARFSKVSPWHYLYDKSAEAKLIKLFSHSFASVRRERGQSVLFDARYKRSFVRPCENSMLVLPLRFIQVNDEPIPFASTYYWGGDWKARLKKALSDADTLVNIVTQRLHIPFIISDILRRFLAETDGEAEERILLQTPIAVMAKIFLDGINTTKPT